MVIITDRQTLVRKIAQYIPESPMPSQGLHAEPFLPIPPDGLPDVMLGIHEAVIIENEMAPIVDSQIIWILQ